MQQKVVMLVTGYIRSQKHNSIPQDIQYLILAFYHQREEFVMFPKCLSVTGQENNIVTSNVTGWHTAYGVINVEAKPKNIVYEWKFKMLKVGKWVAIGIHSEYDAIDDYLFSSTRSGVYYGLHRSGRKYSSFIESGANRNYMNGGYKTNDILIFRVNMEHETISFIKNDVDYGIAFDNVDTSFQYHLAVCLDSIGDSIEIVQFRSYAV